MFTLFPLENTFFYQGNKFLFPLAIYMFIYLNDDTQSTSINLALLTIYFKLYSTYEFTSIILFYLLSACKYRFIKAFWENVGYTNMPKSNKDMYPSHIIYIWLLCKHRQRHSNNGLRCHWLYSETSTLHVFKRRRPWPNIAS